ncbi:MAG: hypothetical protein QW767_06920 [Thermoprotei archaeon]
MSRVEACVSLALVFAVLLLAPTPYFAGVGTPGSASSISFLPVAQNASAAPASQTQAAHPSAGEALHRAESNLGQRAKTIRLREPVFYVKGGHSVFTAVSSVNATHRYSSSNASAVVAWALAELRASRGGSVVFSNTSFPLSGSLLVGSNTTVYFNGSTIVMASPPKFNRGLFNVYGSQVNVEGIAAVKAQNVSGVYVFDVFNSSQVNLNIKLNASGFARKLPDSWASYYVNLFNSTDVEVSGGIRGHSGDLVQLNSGYNVSITGLLASYMSDTDSSVVNVFDQAGRLSDVTLSNIVIEGGGELSVTPIVVYGYANSSLSQVHIDNVSVSRTRGNADGVDVIGAVGVTVSGSRFYYTNVGLSVVSSDVYATRIGGSYDRAPSVEVGDPVENMTVSNVTVADSYAYGCGVGNYAGSVAAAGFAVYGFPGKGTVNVTFTGDLSEPAWPRGQLYGFAATGLVSGIVVDGGIYSGVRAPLLPGSRTVHVEGALFLAAPYAHRLKVVPSVREEPAA